MKHSHRGGDTLFKNHVMVPKMEDADMALSTVAIVAVCFFAKQSAVCRNYAALLPPPPSSTHTYMWLVAFHLRGAPSFIRPVAVLGSGAAAANRVTNYYTLDIGRGRNRNKVCVRVGVGEERALPAERLFVNKDHFVLLEHQPGEMCCCCEVSSEAVGINSWNFHPKHQRIKIVCVDIYWRQLNMHNSIGGEYKAVKCAQRNEL